jgi:hypothetical protein
VFDDLVMPAIMSPDVKWKLVSMLETPIVPVGGRYYALSSDVKAIAGMDDYMLRLAARLDQDQYSKASTLREGRMIEMCREAFENCQTPWTFKSRVQYRRPDQEADVVATRESTSVVLQLKSTLRPETPWEVRKRNEAVTAGIGHTKSLLERRIADQGFVVTDGYRGDYACWAEAIESGVAIATLSDLDVIAANPVAAVQELEKRVGIVDPAQDCGKRIPDRETELMGWILRFVDKEAP